MTLNEFYRHALFTELEQAGMSADTCDKALTQYDRITGLGRSPEFGFRIMHNCCFASEQTEKKIQSIRQQLAQSAQASEDFSNVLSPAARAIHDALKGKKIEVKNKKSKLTSAIEKLSEKEELEVEVSASNRLRLGVLTTDEKLNESGMLERHRIYKAVASMVSEKVPGLAVDIKI